MFKIRHLLLGKPRDPMQGKTRKNIALIALFAWIGLGADGLSSSSYGPEEAFKALGTHTYLAIYLAILTAITVFLISFAYNQVIQLFPNGGGGYKTASKLIGPRAGLVSGSALIIDYTLTIAISVAAGTDALFSLIPATYQPYKLIVEPLILLLLLVINLRGAKESIKVLMVIFLGFFVTHAIVIIAGIIMHDNFLGAVAHNAIHETGQSIKTDGFILVAALFLRAYSLGGGTYTGLEAVSNNVNILVEPRVKTGRVTMFYMAFSLSFVAGGIILLYLLWHVHPEAGQTLNAIAFRSVLVHWPFHHAVLMILLFLEAGLLFMAANTGFLAGPAVLANMSLDSWVPHRFGILSSRLVTQNGVIFFALAAMLVLLGTDGRVEYIVVLYSMNVFLTFSMSLLGLTIYWWTHRKKEKRWYTKLFLSVVALIVCVSILFITLITKLTMGGWVTVVVTSLTVACGLFIKRHYKKFRRLKIKLNLELHIPLVTKEGPTPSIDPKKPTAVFLVKEIGAAMHSLLWVVQTFPDHFHNFVFISFGEVDRGSYDSEASLKQLEEQTDGVLSYLVKYSQLNGIAAESYRSFGTDVVEEVMMLSEEVNKKYEDTLYFASKYVYSSETWLTRLLHSDIGSLVQRRLQAMGGKMLILPLKLDI